MNIAGFKVSHSSDKDATALRAARSRSSSIGAMEEMSGKVQNESTHILRRKITSTRTAFGQFKGQFNGAMEP